MSLADRFWTKVITGPDCWEWTGTKNNSGGGWAMKLRFEVELDGRYVTLRDVSKRAAELYGRWSETQDDDDFDALVEEVIDDIAEAVVISVLDAEIGR